MGEANFYTAPDSQTVLDHFNDTKKELEKAMGEWEVAHEKLEKYNV